MVIILVVRCSCHDDGKDRCKFDVKSTSEKCTCCTLHAVDYHSNCRNQTTEFFFFKKGQTITLGKCTTASYHFSNRHSCKCQKNTNEPGKSS